MIVRASAKTTLLILAGIASFGAPSFWLSASAQTQFFGRSDEQDAARRAMLDGQVMPFSIIKRRVDKEVGEATYLGSEFDSRRNSYRLKYVRQGKVVWVDVDGRTGDIIGWAR